MKSTTALSIICAIVFAYQAKAQDESAPPNHEEIKAKLGWMIGTWERKTEEGTQHEFECKWVLDNQFIQGSVMLGTPLEEWLRVFIGWNPVDKKLTVAGFNRRGGQGSGKYVESGGGETHFTLKGVEPAGQSSMTLIYAHTDDDKLIVEYRNWLVGDEKKEPLMIEFSRKKMGK